MFDTSLRCQLNRNVQLALNINNLFDHYYYADIAPTSSHIRQGRTAMLTLRTSY